ncbi:MAG TPA: NAD(P)H-dependent oxidoreductase subunit E, partial [Gemmatimonadaceae bacterium]
MDVRLLDAAPTTEEREAVDACLGPPTSAWDGGARGSMRDAHVAHGGADMRARRHELLPALRALQASVGWISEGGLAYICERLDVPPADAWGVATFYALLSTTPRAKRVLHVCDDIACKFRGSDALIAELEARYGPAHAHAPHGDHVSIGDDDAVWVRSPCLGMCDGAPAAMLQQSGPNSAEALFGGVTVDQAVELLTGGFASRTAHAVATAPSVSPAHGAVIHSGADSRLLARIGTVDPTSIDAFTKSGGFEALEKALGMTPEAVVAEVLASKLMGRGGAAFPTGRKWEAVAGQPVRRRYLICNADESEPGTFKDRVLMEGDPFAIVEAMVIAAHATGCENGYIYIRGEYPLATERLQHAIDESRSRRFLGRDILGRGVAFDIEIRRGAGAYICG